MRLIIKPKWAELERVRRQGAEFLKSQGLRTDVVDAIVMVLSELAENSIKYGDFGVPENRVVVEASIVGKSITVEVSNPVDERAHEHLTRLDKTIQWIRGYQDSFESYVERLKEVAKKPLSDRESGLGLVRIAYEGKAILDFYVDEKATVNVSAVANIQ